MAFPKTPFCLILAVCMALTACTTSATDPTPTSAPPAATATHTQSPASTTAKANIQTPEPSETASLITPMTPIAIEQMKVNFIQLLQPNPDCILPCWGGVEPGETTWEEAVTHFTGLGASLGRYRVLSNGIEVYEVYGFGFDDPPNDWFPGPVVSLFRLDDKLIGLKVFVDGNDDIEEMRVVWEQYFPETLLRIDMPSSIWIDLPRENSKYTSYVTWLRYDDEGYWVKYYGESETESSNYPICLSMTEGGNLRPLIEILSIGSTDEIKLTELYESMVGPIIFYRNREIKKATGISIEDFTQLMRTQEGMAECIYAPVE